MKRIFSRRAFLKGSAAAAGGVALSKTVLLEAKAFPRAVAPSDRVRLAMVDASHKNNRIVQIGSQRVSSVLCETARDLYQKGTIGDVEMVELTLGRNDPTGAWEYPPPPDLSTQTLDWDTWLNDAPKVPFNPLHFGRWRCWTAYGQ